MPELWQLYDEQGRAITGKGDTKAEILSKALLHGASHVWVWRVLDHGPEILLQQRSSTKLVSPNCYDVSAAGHIRLGEDPIATAIREVYEELGIVYPREELCLVGLDRRHLTGSGRAWIENEFCWVYTAYWDKEENFTLEHDEVAALVWQPISVIRADINDAGRYRRYSQHGIPYFTLVLDAITRQSQAH